MNELLTQHNLDITEDSALKYYETCKGRCDHSNIFTCRCDELCPYYGDCCIDYDLVCLNSTIANLNDASLYGNIAKHTMYQCVSDPSLDSYVWLVTRCPASWKESFVEFRCTDQDLSMHVFDRSGISYFNIFCAFCHGLSLKDIEPWNIKRPEDPGRKRNVLCREP